MTVFRHRILGNGAGDELWVTTLHTEGAGALADVHTAFNAFAVAIWTGAMAAKWNTNTGMIGTVTDALDAVTGHNVAQATSGDAHFGTATDSPGSPRACIVVGLQTALPTRAGRGRMFWPGPTAASVDDAGKITSGTQSAIVTAFDAALTTLAGVSTPVIYHRKNAAELLLGELPSTTDINGIRVGKTLGTQRRRTNKTTNIYASAAL